MYYYKLTEVYQTRLSIIGKSAQILYKDKVLADLQTNGMLTVFPGFCWDGCSPRLHILGLFWIGTPNGVVDHQTGKPLLYYASLVHDILCQWIKEDKTKVCTRKEADIIFKNMGQRFALISLYYWLLRIFGY